MELGSPTTRQPHVYVGTAGHSAWFSEDSGETWLHPNSHSGMYLEARVWTIAAHSSTPDRLFAGTDMGAFRWDEAAARWSQLPALAGDVWALAIDPANPDVLLAGTRPAAFWRSEDAGRSWTKLEAPGLSQFSEINMGPTRVTQILFDPVDPDTVWATVEIGSIYRSTDRGLTWTRKDAGLISADLHGIAVILTGGGGRALLATTNRGLHRSEDGGESWVHQELPSPWQYTRGVMPRADDPSIVFLANGNGPPGNDGKLLRSRDYGKSWEDAGLPGELNSSVWSIATDPADPRLIFTCTNLGQLFRSTDGGESWTRLPHEFGEVRALFWRTLPAGIRQQEHSITRRAVRASEMVPAA